MKKFRTKPCYIGGVMGALIYNVFYYYFNPKELTFGSLMGSFIALVIGLWIVSKLDKYYFKQKYLTIVLYF